MKSYAPCLMAATAISIFPWPEMITTGTCGWSRWAIFKISIPSILLSFSQMSKINSDGELVQRLIGPQTLESLMAFIVE